MNKRVLFSLSILIAAVAVVVGATGAFFSDTETSTGNIFKAGSIDLKVDSECHYYNLTGFEPTGEPVYTDVGCGEIDSQTGVGIGNWRMTDLVDGVHKFFSFEDIKPGDWGEDTISLHVFDNDAWGWFTVRGLSDNENDCTEPELEAEPNCKADEDGELDEAVLLTIWLDQGTIPGFQNYEGRIDEFEGDNVWQPEEGQPLESGYIHKFDPFDLSLVLSGAYNLYCRGNADPSGHNNYEFCHGLAEDGRMVGSTTYYFGVKWELPIETGNNVQTDSFSGDMEFVVVQHRNNPTKLGGPEAELERPLIGANLGRYSQPSSCDVIVGSGGESTIQAGVDVASAGQTVCVDAGIYDEDVVINKSLTLAGDGAGATSIINGQSTAYVGAITVSTGVDNVTIEGFEINGAGQAAIYLVENNSGITISSNKLVSPSGSQKNALLSGGFQSNNTIINNEFVGVGAAQLVYINGAASVSKASDNVDFTYNTFSGTIVSGGIALGNEAGNSTITENVFDATLTSTYAILDLWEDTIVVNTNNFNSVSGTKVMNGDTGMLDAENNWWGDNDPSNNVSGNVDYDPWESSAYPEN